MQVNLTFLCSNKTFFLLFTSSMGGHVCMDEKRIGNVEGNFKNWNSSLKIRSDSLLSHPEANRFLSLFVPSDFKLDF